ncbi:hypothetical protein [Actinophytocola sp.]|uniref:hypothetical protein n=1 Tax=Actinophytocola sp. TaxID=1872138 RepID=UPI002D7EF92D|nr:hypothetical protein [Actinophytocola sp.]HET9143421.1 hypothetical protein [Actinophytocola sp.]
MTRVLLAVAGLAALAWAAVLAWDFAATSASGAVQAAAWFVAGPLLHDAIFAPAAAAVAVVAARRLPVRWRAPVAAGGVLSAVLAILAVPLLWRPFGVPTNPGLHDRDYTLGLLIALGVVWLGVLTAGSLNRTKKPHSS